MIDWCDKEYNFWQTDISLSPAEENWLEEDAAKKGFKRFAQTGLVQHYMASRMRKKDRSGPYPYDRVHPLALLHAYQCSNQCEHIYSKSGLGKHVNRRIYIIESRIESSSERDQNQLQMQKNDKQYRF